MATKFLLKVDIFLTDLVILENWLYKGCFLILNKLIKNLFRKNTMQKENQLNKVEKVINKSNIRILRILFLIIINSIWNIFYLTKFETKLTIMN